MKPRLSVIIPTYSRTDSLARSLEALKSQTLKNIEVILVDQNEPHYLENNISHKLLQNVQIVRLEDPNASTARNVGFRYSSSDYIYFMDDDIIPEKTFFEKGVEILEIYPEIGCLCPLVYNDLGKEHALSTVAKILTKTNALNSSLFIMKQTMYGTVFFQKDYYIKSGGFDGLLFQYAGTGEDQELYFRMKLRGLNVWLDTDLAIYHDEKISGGCDLRTVPYWATREKCVKSWVFRYRIHSSINGKLNPVDIFKLMRSSFLNKTGLRSGIGHTIRQFVILCKWIKHSKHFLKPHIYKYADIKNVDHIY